MKKTNKILTIFLISIIILSSVFQISYAQSVSQDTYVILYLNKTQVNVIKGELSSDILLEAAPYAPNGTTLVPIRAVLEAFSANLDWDNEKQQVNIYKDDIKIVLTIGSKSALVGGKNVELAEPAKILNGRTLIPLRFVSESLGLSVKWYQESKKIIISNVGFSKGVSVAKSEYYNENPVDKNDKTINENDEEFSKYEFKNNVVTAACTTKKLDKINNTACTVDCTSTTTIEKDGQNSVINEISKSESGEVLSTVEGYSNAQYDRGSRDINIVSNETIKSPSGETIKTRRIKSYISLNKKNTLVINSSIYEYLPGGDCISYYEEGSDYINGNMSSYAERMDNTATATDKYISKSFTSSADTLIYNGIVLSDKGILTSEKIDISQPDSEVKPEIFNKIKEGLEKVQETIDISKYVDNTTTIEEVLEKYDEVLDENPDIFYCYSNILYSYGGILKPVYIFPKEDIQTIRDDLNNKIEVITNEIIKPGMTDFRKELAIHDYIVKNTKYDENNFVINTVPPQDHTAYGIIIKGTGVCDGYAKATKLLSDKVGVECSIINGEVRSRDNSAWNLHAWNQVKINGEYYHEDVTWDDPVPDGSDNKCYNYLNVTDKAISANHKWDSVKYPVCDAIDYNYFYMNNAIIDSYQSFTDYILNSVKAQQKEILIKISNYNENVYNVSNAVQNIWNNDAYSISSCNYSVDKDMGTIRIRFEYK